MFWDTCVNFVHSGISLNGIEGIQWQITHHGEGMTCHEDIEMTYIIIISSMIFITIKPCRCNGSFKCIQITKIYSKSNLNEILPL
jgi:hypothetical protein